MNNRELPRSDYFGMAVSAACVVHCLLTPLAVALFPAFAHAIPASESIHRSLVIVVISIGVLAFRSGYKRHRRRIVLLPMAIGMGTMVAAVLLGDSLSHLAETLVTLIGSVFVIRAHWMNHSFCRDCSRCVPVREKSQHLVTQSND
jgi:hypothetical protein